jgi:hypothetical protein
MENEQCIVEQPMDHQRNKEGNKKFMEPNGN